MRGTVLITLDDGSAFRARIRDIRIERETRSMHVFGGHEQTVAVGLPAGTLDFFGTEPVKAPSPPLPTPDPLDTENPDWGTWS